MRATLDASAPLGRGFRHEARAPLADFEDVLVAPRWIARVDNLVIGGLRFHLDRQPIALAANAFDLNHDRILSASLLLASCAERIPPERNRGAVAQARSTVSAMLSGNRTAPRACASSTSCNA